ncbi:MAG TPA: DNA polymerase I, partial [Planctomycetes bacterium]|nr:DNA polymerase I [Planctomycetota bacterium]
VGNIEELSRILNDAKSAGRFAFDLETSSASPVDADIVGISISFREGEAWYIPVRGPEKNRILTQSEVLVRLKPLLADENTLKIGQNLKYDLQVLANVGIEVSPPIFDTMIAAYVLDPGGRAFGIDYLSLTYLGEKKTPTSEIIGKGSGQRRMDEISVSVVAGYAAEDADCTFRLASVLREKVHSAGLDGLLDTLEIPLVPVLARMELAGIAIDVQWLKSLERDFEKHIADLEDKIRETAGVAFSPASPRQLADVLFGKLGLPVIKKGKTGPSTDSEVLDRLSEKHPLPSLVLQYREFSKLKNTYIDTIPAMLSPRTGRLHTSFNQTGTATGRLSSSEPNLQNIPIRTELGRRIRRAFVPRNGCVFVSADYSQIELRILAHFSEDAALIASFRRGEDIHCAVAAEVFDKPIDAVSDEERRVAKAVNFGLVYGQGAQGLARQTGLSVDDAEDFIQRYFRRYPGVKTFIDALLEKAEKDGFVETIAGRRRMLPDLAAQMPVRRNAARRAAVNTVIQGSAADLIKRAMINLDAELLRSSPRSRILLQIHDELLLEAPSEEVAALQALLKKLMENALHLRVPLLAQCSVGSNWMDL